MKKATRVFMNFSLTESYSKTGFIKSKDQTSLFYRHYPVSHKKAIVFLVHGFGEHSGRYTHVIDRLREESFEVFCIDFRGHGHSKGKRGDVETFSHYVEDVVAGIEHIEKNLRHEKNLFLIAHSMGALASLHATVNSQISVAGLILSCPLFALRLPIPKWKQLASFAAAKMLPQLRVATGIKGRHLSSDQKFANAYDNDPLVLKNLSVRAFREIFIGYQNIDSLAERISSSLFLQIAGTDPVVDSKTSEKWFQTLREDVDGSLKIYPEFLHEIYNEANRKLAIDDAIFWLNARVSCG